MHEDRTPSTTAARPPAGPGSPPIIDIRLFQEGDGPAFRVLNEEWIARYFSVEEKDKAVLGDPARQILEPGGHILIAVAEGTPIGCCALIAMEPGVYEVAKMAVRETHRNHGVGRRILSEVVAHARAVGARRLYLETNHILENAIHLYESIGFRHVPPERVKPSPYARADVYMEMDL